MPITLTTEQAWHYRVVPQQTDDGAVFLTDAEPATLPALQEELEFLLEQPVQFTSIDPNDLNQYLHAQYPMRAKDPGQEVYTGEADRFLPELIAEAQRLKSSDIHIEVYEGQARVRIRIDGQMIGRYRLPMERYPTIINKIKILSHLDIAEKRLPQDGRIHFQEGAASFDIRVSILPTLYGEKVVLRLLSKDAVDMDIRRLGFGEKELEDYLQAIQRPNGMVLISGPTGSGKTTTLYASLKLLNQPTRNILTIEDPIEYTLEGVNQVQLKENIGLGFAAALRTFLRQDPDIIMVGEIRDVETANMAIRASLTGHLVLSTIHTNSAWGTVSRLVDMGIPSFLLANTLNVSVAQRLVRLLCPYCKKEEPFAESLYPRQFKAPYVLPVHWRAQGCSSCYHTGYKGRKALYEIIPIDAGLGRAIKEQVFEVGNLLRERGIRHLWENAFELFAQGETSLEEIYPLLFNF